MHDDIRYQRDLGTDAWRHLVPMFRARMHENPTTRVRKSLNRDRSDQALCMEAVHSLKGSFMKLDRVKARLDKGVNQRANRMVAHTLRESGVRESDHVWLRMAQNLSERISESETSESENEEDDAAKDNKGDEPTARNHRRCTMPTLSSQIPRHSNNSVPRLKYSSEPHLLYEKDPSPPITPQVEPQVEEGEGLIKRALNFHRLSAGSVSDFKPVWEFKNPADGKRWDALCELLDSCVGSKQQTASGRQPPGIQAGAPAKSRPQSAPAKGRSAQRNTTAMHSSHSMPQVVSNRQQDSRRPASAKSSSRLDRGQDSRRPTSAVSSSRREYFHSAIARGGITDSVPPSGSRRPPRPQSAPVHRRSLPRQGQDGVEHTADNSIQSARAKKTPVALQSENPLTCDAN